MLIITGNLFYITRERERKEQAIEKLRLEPQNSQSFAGRTYIRANGVIQGMPPPFPHHTTHRRSLFLVHDHLMDESAQHPHLHLHLAPATPRSRGLRTLFVCTIIKTCLPYLEALTNTTDRPMLPVGRNAIPRKMPSVDIPPFSGFFSCSQGEGGEALFTFLFIVSARLEGSSLRHAPPPHFLLLQSQGEGEPPVSFLAEWALALAKPGWAWAC